MSKDNDNNKKVTEGEREFSSMDIRKRKLELVEMFDDVFAICRALVDIGKTDPTKIKASMMAQIMRLMTQGSNILQMAESLKEEIQEDIDKEDGDGMTPEESQILKEFQESQKGADLGAFKMKDSEKDNDKKSAGFHNDFGYGLNYKRS